jgi:hypothetical protein
MTGLTVRQWLDIQGVDKLRSELEIKCQELYEQGGQHNVYAYIMENHKEVDWNECIPCEAWSPVSNGACLVCASEVSV